MSLDLDRIIAQSLWANLEWIDYVYSTPDPEARPRELLAHILYAERVWFERVDGGSKITETFLHLPREELVKGFHENDATYRRLAAAGLDRVVQFKRFDGAEYHATVGDILQHLITHGYHHRGQLAAHYARGGVTYPSTDHIDWLIRNRL